MGENLLFLLGDCGCGHGECEFSKIQPHNWATPPHRLIVKS